MRLFRSIKRNTAQKLSKFELLAPVGFGLILGPHINHDDKNNIHYRHGSRRSLNAHFC